MEKSFWKRAGREKVLGCCAFALFLLLLVPLFRIAVYAVPWYDDLNYGRFAKFAMETTPGLGGALSGAWDCVRTQWYAWQGTFSSIFFMAMMPAIWGEEYYFLGPMFLIALLSVSVLLFVRVVLRDVFGADGWNSLLVQSVTASMVLVLIHSSQEGLFWYNAGVHYVGMHSFAMLLLTALIRIFYEKRTWVRVLLAAAGMVLALLVSGGNFVTALQGAVLLGFCLILVLWKKRSLFFFYLPAAVVYGVGFYLNVSAPGNSVRAANYVGWGYPPVEAVLRSFSTGVRMLPEFSGYITPAVLILLLPTLWRIAGKSRCAFRYPGAVLFLSLCLYASGFTPSLYSLGHEGLARSLNAVKITLQLLLVLDELYLLGWLRRVWEKKSERISERKLSGIFFWSFYLVMGAVMLCIFYHAPNQAGCYSSYGAYYYVHTGEAYNFYCEYRERLELLQSEEKNIVFEPYRYRPWLLCMGDLDEDPQAEENRAVEAWYNKDSVAVRGVD